MKTSNILFALLILTFLSCGDNEIEEPYENIFGYEYFPLAIGNTWEYQVDSVLIVQGGIANIVSTSFIQEKVTDLLSDENGEKLYRLERSYRPDQNSSWSLRDVWQVGMTDRRATRTEENLRFIKLVFPAVKDERWDGNVFFDANKEFTVAANGVTIYQDWSYKIEEVNLSRAYNGTMYDDVMHVSHIDEESLISRRFSEEYYVKGIGLVERNMDIFDSQNGNTMLTWLERAEKGFQLKQTLLSFTEN
ncbi:MAG: hypothetical protein AAGA77_08450 [Bacteroidota bacterium]